VGSEQQSGRVAEQAGQAVWQAGRQAGRGRG